MPTNTSGVHEVQAAPGILDNIVQRPTATSGFVIQQKTVFVLAEVVRAPEGGFAAFIPALPGCAAQNESEPDVLEDLKSLLVDMIYSYGGVKKLPLLDKPPTRDLKDCSTRYITVNLDEPKSASGYRK